MRSLLFTLLALTAAPSAFAAIPPTLDAHTVGSLTLATDLPAREGEDLAHRIAVAHRLITARLEAILHVQSAPQPLTIVLFRHAEAWERFTHEHAPERLGAGAWYDGVRRWVVTYQLGHGDAAICHELVHASLGTLLEDPGFSRYRRPGWPIWLEEGLAEFLGHCALDVNPVLIGVHGIERTALLLNAMEDGTLPDPEAAPRWTVDDFSGPSSGIRYAHSAALAERLVASERGRQQIRGALLQGAPLVPAGGSIPAVAGARSGRTPANPLQRRWILHGGGQQTESLRGPGVHRTDGEAFLTQAILPLHSWNLKWSGTWTGKSASLSLGDHRPAGSEWTVRLKWDADTLELAFGQGPVVARIPASSSKEGRVTLQLRATDSGIHLAWQGKEARVAWPGSHRISRVGFGVEAGSLQTHSLKIESLLSAPSDAAAPATGDSRATSPPARDRQSTDN